MASRALIFQLLADFHKDVAVVALCGDHEGTVGDAPKRRLGSGIGLFSAPTLQPSCGKQGRRASQYGFVIWQGPIRLSWLGGHGGLALPRRGCIFTMADHYQDRPFPTDADHDRGAHPYLRGESEPLAELAQLTGQTDLFGTAAKPPVPLQSRANVRPQYAPAEEEASAPAGPPPWRLRARQEAPPLQPEQPSPVHPVHRYAAPPAAASEQDHHEPQQDTDEQPADLSRYDDALYGPIKSVEGENGRDPAYPDD